jgi:peroxiredoxin
MNYLDRLRGGVFFLLALVLGTVIGLAQSPPPNDLFAKRIPLTGTNLTAAGSNRGATKETGEPDHAQDPGGRSVWWSWTAPLSGFAKISTTGSNFDTLLGVYLGNTVSQLTEVDSADDDDFDLGILTGTVNPRVQAGQTYQIAVDGFAGESGDIRLRIQAYPFPPAPSWTLRDVNGTAVSSSLFAGKVVILNFWATWCDPCRAEIPAFINLKNSYGADGLVVVGISVDEGGTQVVRNFIASYGINYYVVMSSASVVQAYGGISAIPTTFIIDRQNRIMQKFVGARSEFVFAGEVLPLLYANLQLRIQRAGGNFKLQWPATAASFVLESAPNSANRLWTPLPASSQLINGQRTVELPVTESQSFFRLRLQN